MNWSPGVYKNEDKASYFSASWLWMQCDLMTRCHKFLQLCLPHPDGLCPQTERKNKTVLSDVAFVGQLITATEEKLRCFSENLPSLGEHIV